MKRSLGKFQIKPESSITDALKKIDEAGEKILFVVDKNSVFLGSLTDGDIRRWIIKKGSLNGSIEKIYNRNPVFLDKNYNVELVKKIMLKNKIERIPVIDSSKQIVEILLWEDIFSDNPSKPLPNLDVPVVIMAGGMGSRLDPLTKILPKPLIPLKDKPVAEVIMDKFVDYGCNHFYLILNYKSGMIKSYFDNNNLSYQINYIYEDKPLGTAGGLKLLPKMKINTFFVTNCDVIINTSYDEIYNFHKKNKFALTLVGCARNFIIPYGIVEVKKEGMLSKITEKPQFNLMANAGMYIIERDLLDLIPHNRTFHMNELINKAEGLGKRIGVYPVSEKAWIDVGQWKEYHSVLRGSDL